MTATWQYVDDPEAPCAYGVGWRCVHCKQGMCDYDTCPEPDSEYEPYRPDGSTITEIYSGIHPACQQMVDDYMEDVRRNPS